MGNNPSIFSKTPMEFARATRDLRNQRYGLLVLHAMPPPPPGYVRVHFYTHMSKIRKEVFPDMEADVPVEPLGELDLQRVNELWGLEKCLPIDPMRWVVFRPGEPNRLSPIALQVLSEGQGCIKFVEAKLSKQTRRKRACRKAILSVSSSIAILCRITYQSCADTIEAHTPFPAWYRSAQNACREIKWERKRLDVYDPRRRPKPNRGPYWEMIILWDWKPVFQFCLLLLFLAFMAAVYGGHIEMALRQRGRNWARTGSLLL